MNMKSAIAGIVFMLFAGPCSASYLSNLLGPQLYGAVGAQLGWSGFGDFSSQLGNYYSSLPAGTICAYSFCNTDAASGAINSMNLFSGLSYGLFGPGGTALYWQ
jgi:hypothetical protein